MTLFGSLPWLATVMLVLETLFVVFFCVFAAAAVFKRHPRRPWCAVGGGGAGGEMDDADADAEEEMENGLNGLNGFTGGIMRTDRKGGLAGSAYDRYEYSYATNRA